MYIVIHCEVSIKLILRINQALYYPHLWISMQQKVITTNLEGSAARTGYLHVRIIITIMANSAFFHLPWCRLNMDVHPIRNKNSSFFNITRQVILQQRVCLKYTFQQLTKQKVTKDFAQDAYHIFICLM